MQVLRPNLNEQKTPATTKKKPMRTPAEQEILNGIKRLDGKEFAEKNAVLIPAQAREFGELRTIESLRSTVFGESNAALTPDNRSCALQ